MSTTEETQQQDALRRRGEDDDKCHYRSHRFFLANGEWFFDTREHTHVGPFGSEAAASRGLELYLQEMASESSSIAVARARASNGHWSITNYQ